MADLSKEMVEALRALVEVHDRRFGEIAQALDRVATQLKYLGNGDTAMGMGAIEYLAVSLRDAGDAVAGAIANAGDDS